MKFIHFGCWNYGLCNMKDINNDLSRVMVKLNKYVISNKPDFITIAGDNYYEEKKDKKEKKDKQQKSEEQTGETKQDSDDTEITIKLKDYNETNLYSGLNCLPRDILKYVLLGNHEYDIMKGHQENKCFLLETQKAKLYNNTHFFNDVIVRRTVNTLILMIDTTLYDENSYKKFTMMCFEGTFSGIPARYKTNYETLVTYQNNTILKYIRENSDVQNIVIIGHHPIVTVKLKKDKIKAEKLIRLEELYKQIASESQDKNIYHLCADNHLYQKGSITINGKVITQYVCGTGGAEKDTCPSSEQVSKETYADCYKIEECKAVNGFLVVEEKDKSLEFNFIDVITEELVSTLLANTDTKTVTDIPITGGNYYIKYLKYKQKYLELKNKY